MPKLCVITSSRADYGLLYFTMLKIKASKKFQLQVIATGSHLSSHHGKTVDLIKKDGFKIDAEIDLKIENQNLNELHNSASIGIKEVGHALTKLNPDALLVLGDRYEIACAALAASIACIPIVHFHGGEISMGANDEMFRHAITKLSSLHFVSTSAYRKRVIQLGENPKNVFLSGALGIEGVRKLKLKSLAQLEKELGIKFLKKLFLVTLHPETLGKSDPKKFVLSLLNALKKYKDATIIITKANADKDGAIINGTINAFIADKPNFKLFASLGQVNYFSLMQRCTLVIGNSSSGIIEAPSFNKVNINIGNRQKGRVAAKSNIDTKASTVAIVNAIKKGLKQVNKKVKNPYDNGDASNLILRTLSKQNFSKLLPKTFYNLH